MVKNLDDGYEGLMLRAPDGPYKFGRSTVKENTLLKVKNFLDDEAEVIGFKEQTTNTNVNLIKNNTWSKLGFSSYY